MGVETVSCGGNMLLNIGPTHYGEISPIYEERLRDIGNWLKINGEAIYSTTPWTYQNDTITPNVWYTKSKSADGYFGIKPVFATILTWPEDNVVHLGAPTAGPITRISFLGYNEPSSGKSSLLELRFLFHRKIKFQTCGRGSSEWIIWFIKNIGMFFTCLTCYCSPS